MAKSMRTVIGGKPIATRTSKKHKMIVAKSLSLDEIEQKMIELATTETSDPVINMANETKLNMLEKVANFKLKRLQLKELESNKVVEKTEPIKIEFVNSQTEEQQKRLEKIDSEIIGNKHIVPNA